MKNSAADSAPRKAIADSQSNKTVIVSALCLITLGANIAYSAVAIIYPPTMTKHGLGTLYTAVVIAGYPFT